MNEYRKKFVLLYMISIVTVLAVVLAGIFIYNYRQNYHSLKSTMSMVLEPYEDMQQTPGSDSTKPVHSSSSTKPSGTSQSSSDSSESNDNSGEESTKNSSSSDNTSSSDSEAKPDPPTSPSSKNTKHYSAGTFESVVYYTDEDTYSVISKKELFDDDQLAAMILAVTTLDESFGKVPGYNVYYYKSEGTDSVKVAFVAGSYLYTPLIKLFFILLLIFAGSVVVFLVISVKLSKVAVKPLEQSIEMQQQFITDVSHDLKTPITIILANNTILSQHKEEKIEDQIQWIENTNEAAQGMLSMINEMLTLSSVEQQPENEEMEELDATSIITQAELQMESVAYERKIELEADIEDDLVIKGKKEYLKRIISSLLDNALKYEPAGGKIYCRAKHVTHGVEITVQNCSATIDETELPHLFERFYRADSSRTKSNSFGLGLSITKAMTEAMGGTISVTSNPVEGTTFKVIFQKIVK